MSRGETRVELGQRLARQKGMLLTPPSEPGGCVRVHCPYCRFGVWDDASKGFDVVLEKYIADPYGCPGECHEDRSRRPAAEDCRRARKSALRGENFSDPAAPRRSGPESRPAEKSPA